MLGKIFVGFDLETGSAFDDEGRKIITEVGAVKYVYTKDGFKPFDVFTSIVNEGLGVHPDAVEYTGITPRLVEDFGRPLKAVLEAFDSFVSDASYVVSHNGDCFDVPVLKDAYEHAEVETKYFFDIVNIDTMTCISYPNNCKSSNLTYLQAFYGFVNPFPHRAYADVMAMMKLLDNFVIEEVCEVAESPNVKYSAVFSYPKESSFPHYQLYQTAMADFNKKKDQVKAAGFRWHPDTKKWIYEGKDLIFKRDIQPKLACPVNRLS